MPTLTIEYRNDQERCALEQAVAYVADLHRLARDAPDGTVLNACEKLAVQSGRELLCSTLATALETRVTATEQKGGRHALVPTRTPDAPKASTPVRC